MHKLIINNRSEIIYEIIKEYPDLIEKELKINNTEYTYMSLALKYEKIIIA